MITNLPHFARDPALPIIRGNHEFRKRRAKSVVQARGKRHRGLKVGRFQEEPLQCNGSTRKAARPISFFPQAAPSQVAMQRLRKEDGKMAGCRLKVKGGKTFLTPIPKSGMIEEIHRFTDTRN